MKYKNMYQKKCLVCGKEFEHGRSNKDCAKARAAGMSYGQYDLARRLGRLANG